MFKFNEFSKRNKLQRSSYMILSLIFNHDNTNDAIVDLETKEYIENHLYPHT